MLDFKRIGEAVEFIAKEKNIPAEELVAAIEGALKVAYKKDYGNKEDQISVNLDLDNKELEITLEKTLVEEVEDEFTEITRAELEEQLGDDANDFEIGDIVEFDVTDNIMEGALEDTFGRIASQAARQVIVQKISESEKKKLYELFSGREGEAVSMKVQVIENGKVILDYNGDQVALPKSEQVSRDRYEQGHRIFVYIDEVSNDEQTGPKVVISRKPAGLVQRLFEAQVPEMTDGTVRLENIIRQAGIKTKILVSTEFDEIDAAGTMIWPKGLRVRSVMDELNGEKIDIIALNGNMEEVVSKALSPAKVEKVVVNEEDRTATAYVLPTERAKALGKNGLNVTQAGILLDYQIEVLEIGE